MIQSTKKQKTKDKTQINSKLDKTKSQQNLKD